MVQNVGDGDEHVAACASLWFSILLGFGMASRSSVAGPIVWPPLVSLSFSKRKQTTVAGVADNKLAVIVLRDASVNEGRAPTIKKNRNVMIWPNRLKRLHQNGLVSMFGRVERPLIRGLSQMCQPRRWLIASTKLHSIARRRVLDQIKST